VISINNLNLVDENDRVIWLEDGVISYDGAWKNCPLRAKDLGFNVQVSGKKSDEVSKDTPENAKESENHNSNI